ncbi:hypothetical protein [Acidocella sp.]|uniref:hypothetical protein n=1 Tax=Acidocella sp. TaxID=50710 RepID=UPI002616B6D7|nr:hypothetical protein [Acidocella sp.]
MLLTAIATTRHSPHLTAGFLVLRPELSEALECAARGAPVSGSSCPAVALTPLPPQLLEWAARGQGQIMQIFL